MILAAVVGIPIALIITLVLVTNHDKNRIGHAILWISFITPGLLRAPGSATTSQDSSDVAASGAVGAVQALSVALPAVCLLLVVLTTKARRRPLELPEIGLALFALVAVVSTSWSVNPHDTLYKTVPLIVQSLTFVAIARRYDDHGGVMRGLACFAHFMLSTIAIGWAAAPGLARPPVQFGRLQGLLPATHPNMVGLVAVLGLLALVTKQGPRFITTSTPISCLLFAVYTAELLEARTRAALLVGVIAIAAVFAREALRRSGVAMALLIGGGAVAAFVVIQFTSVLAFLQRGQTSAQVTSLSGRSALWDSALTLWRTQPIEGYGYYSGHRYALQPLYTGANQSNIDNMWIETLVNLGVIGAAALAVAVIAGVVRALRVPQSRATRSFTIGALLLLVPATFFNPSIQTTTLAAALFGPILLGSGAAARKPEVDQAAAARDSAGMPARAG